MLPGFPGMLVRVFGLQGLEAVCSMSRATAVSLQKGRGSHRTGRHSHPNSLARRVAGLSLQMGRITDQVPCSDAAMPSHFQVQGFMVELGHELAPLLLCVGVRLQVGLNFSSESPNKADMYSLGFPTISGLQLSEANSG